MTEFNVFSAGSTEAQVKKGLAYLFAGAVTGRANTGVLAGLGVSQTATPSASVVVGAGSAVVQSSTSSGASWPTSDADKTIDVLTASPMGALPRNDLVIFNADTAAIEVVIGTANASPVDPTVSANHIKLARIRNAANATAVPNSAIDNLRVYTNVSGGPFAMATGRYSHTSNISAGSSVGPFAQTFPAGRFTVPPNITIGIVEGSRLVGYATSITTTGFNLYLRNVAASDSPAGVDIATWQAVQMTAGSADG